MSALPAFKFDSLRSFDRLKSSGVAEEQARVIVSLVEESAQNSLENLASKEDFKREILLSEARLDSKITEVKSELKQDIAEVKSELKQDIVLSESRLEGKIFASEARLDSKITEVKQDTSEVKQDISEMKGSLTLLTRMFFATFVVIAVGLVTAVFHH